MMMQQRTCTICSPKLIVIFARLETIKGPIKLRGCEILSFHWIRETVQIEVIIVRPNFHVNISELFTIRECVRPSLKGSVNMDLQEDVDGDDYLRKEVSCSKTSRDIARVSILNSNFSNSNGTDVILFKFLQIFKHSSYSCSIGSIQLPNVTLHLLYPHSTSPYS